MSGKITDLTIIIEKSHPFTQFILQITLNLEASHGYFSPNYVGDGGWSAQSGSKVVHTCGRPRSSCVSNFKPVRLTVHEISPFFYLLLTLMAHFWRVYPDCIKEKNSPQFRLLILDGLEFLLQSLWGTPDLKVESDFLQGPMGTWHRKTLLIPQC